MAAPTIPQSCSYLREHIDRAPDRHRRPLILRNENECGVCGETLTVSVGESVFCVDRNERDDCGTGSSGSETGSSGGTGKKTYASEETAQQGPAGAAVGVLQVWEAGDDQHDSHSGGDHDGNNPSVGVERRHPRAEGGIGESHERNAPQNDGKSVHDGTGSEKTSGHSPWNCHRRRQSVNASVDGSKEEHLLESEGQTDPWHSPSYETDDARIDPEQVNPVESHTDDEEKEHSQSSHAKVGHEQAAPAGDDHLESGGLVKQEETAYMHQHVPVSPPPAGEPEAAVTGGLGDCALSPVPDGNKHEQRIKPGADGPQEGAGGPAANTYLGNEQTSWALGQRKKDAVDWSQSHLGGLSPPERTLPANSETERLCQKERPRREDEYCRPHRNLPPGRVPSVDYR
ncbi:hypothetical protein F5878DRAFT_647210 [Lentinula raphanica]|uniref:Uncharacterized protein n=1 Tax=Lentinula raphanica TaxID=153919 RepID=A0AA38U3Z0_9AGAR|nr:hypothetical protein F5878DRAFT_647210 [Lentinula raphanica]